MALALLQRNKSAKAGIRCQIEILLRVYNSPMRVVALSAHSGPMNMAIDEALTESVRSGKSGPTLRLYRWRGRWLSIGTSQSIQDVDLFACRQARVEVVRRASGGTSVLHTSQIGWSLTLPSTHPFAPGDIVRSYEMQSSIALNICESLGIDARAVDIETARAPLSDPLLAIACFGSLAPFEIVLSHSGKKLIGWGQVRRRGVVMHHGVMSLRFRPADLANLLKTDHPRLSQLLAARVADVATSTRLPVDYASIAKAIVAAHKLVDTEAFPGSLTDEERRRSRQIARDRFLKPGWTARR